MKTKLFLPAVIAAYLMLICILATAQEYTRVQDADILKERQAVLQREYPQVFEKAQIQDVLDIDDSHSIIRYSRDNVYYETIINSGRKDMLMLETAQFIPKEDIPEVVMDAYRENTDGDPEIVKQFIVIRPQGDQLYRLDLDDPKSDNIVTIYFDKFGHPAKAAI